MRGSKAASLARASLRVWLVHPGGVGDEIAIGGAQVADQLVHLALGLGRPVTAGVELADRLAEVRVEQPDAAFPALGLGRDILQRVAVEIEPRLVEGLGQILGMIAEEAEGEIILPGRERHVVEPLASRGDGARFAHVHGRHGAETDMRERRVPLELRERARRAGRGSSDCRSPADRGVSPESTGPATAASRAR